MITHITRASTFKNILFALILVGGFGMGAVSASAETARMTMSAPTAPIAPGSQFTVDIYLSADTPINAFDAAVTYPPDTLQFIDSDNSNSIVDIWQTKPKASADSIGFSGGMLKPFSGTRGLVVALSFKALKEGRPALAFAARDVYMADGNGTKLQAVSSGATLSIKAAAPVISVPVVPFQDTPSDIAIQKNIQTFQSHNTRTALFKASIPLFFAIILAIFAFKVYNKRNRR